LVYRLSSVIDEAEDVVENEVASSTVGQKLECLCVVHGLLLLVNLEYERKRRESVSAIGFFLLLDQTYQQSTSDKDQDTTLLAGGLGVQGRDLMLDLLERQSLFSIVKISPPILCR
jgi:hypothetical protein